MEHVFNANINSCILILKSVQVNKSNLFTGTVKGCKILSGLYNVKKVVKSMVAANKINDYTMMYANDSKTVPLL